MVGCTSRAPSTSNCACREPIGTGLPFQATVPPVCTWMRIGSGGFSTFGGGTFDFCGRSTWIWYVIGGAVTMKMISNTSITSTSGVTFMSAIAPPEELELNAIFVRP